MQEIHNVLVPIDFSERSAAAAEHAVNLARHLQAGVVFLHVIPPMPPVPVLDGGLAMPAAYAAGASEEAAMENALAALTESVAPGLECKRLVTTGDPAQEIERVVEERRVGMVVMPTAGHGKFRRFVLGSLTTKLLNDLRCPIFTGTHVEEIRPFDPAPYRRVGAAVDLDEASAEPLRWAQDFAQAYSAQLLLLHASTGGPNSQDEAERRAQSLLADEGVVAEIRLTAGDAHRALPALAQECAIDVLVVNRHESNGDRGGLRAHAYDLIRRSPCPVMSL